MRFQLLLIALLILFLCGCFTTPSGRSQFMLLSEEEEIALGVNAYAEVLEKSDVVKGGPGVDRVRRIGQRIAAVTGKDYEWEFNLVDDPKQVNAFCLPGGKVVVYTGLMNLAETDDELAVVMGHEIAHATCRHGGSRVSQSVLKGLGLSVAQLFVKTGDEKTDKLLLGALGVGSTLAIELPYSRGDEKEADEVGLRYMYEAGYDPDAAVVFWDKMAGLGGERPPEFLSTHPDPENRMENLRRLAGELKQQGKAG
jgi:predicted Zn-dependent protease